MLVNVYAPNNGLERVRVFDQLHKVLQKFDDDIWLVFVGDWNSTIYFYLIEMEKNHIVSLVNHCPIQWRNMI